MPSKKKIAIDAIATQPLRGRMTWIAALLLGTMAASAQMSAQARPPDKPRFDAPEIAVTYDLERAKIANIGCGCFWLQGGSVDLSVPLYKGLGVAGRFGGGDASNIKPGVNLSEFSYLAGPRYTFGGSRWHGTEMFGEALFGGAHGFNSIFPTGGGVASTANSYAMQFGGGLDVRLSKSFGLRAFELDYVRTALPNNGTNTQNDLRLAFGLSYSFNRK